MSLAVLVQLLPLPAAIIVLVGEPGRQYERARLSLLALAAAFVGFLVTLVVVASEGAISLRFYDPSSIANLALSLGSYIDRLSAVMLVLSSGVGAIIYRYSVNYMYQDRGYGRFLALVAFTTLVLLCMVSSAILVMLFVCWQLLSYLLSLLAHNLTDAATLEGAFRTFTLLRVGVVGSIEQLASRRQELDGIDWNNAVMLRIMSRLHSVCTGDCSSYHLSRTDEDGPATCAGHDRRVRQNAANSSMGLKPTTNPGTDRARIGRCGSSESRI